MAQILTSEFLERAISSAINEEIDLAVKKAIEDAQETIRQRVPEIVASLCLRVQKVMSIETFRDELLVHVRIEGI